MALWTDIIDPQTLTDYARAAQENYERSRGNLARYLPNRTVPDIVVRFLKGQTGLQPAARFRSYDAAIELGSRPSKKRVTLELPALGQNIPVSEYEQLRSRGNGVVPEELALAAIQDTTELAVAAVSDAMESLRGITLATGVATVDQSNFQLAENFGRSASHTVSSPTPWTDTSFDRLTYLSTLCDLYRDDNGEDPGAIVMSDRVYRAFAAGDNMQTVLIGGANRRPSESEVATFLDNEGLPPIDRYNRRIKDANGNTRRALPDNLLLILPAAVDPTAWQDTDLGATFWGTTLSATEPGWGIPQADQPGIFN